MVLRLITQNLKLYFGLLHTCVSREEYARLLENIP